MKNYEIPISPNYVHNWGVQEAVRELLQNAIDADKCGYKKDVLYNKESNLLTIVSTGITLPVSSLVLGCSTKDENESLIGKYGEGYKLALVVLLRKGYIINICNGSQTWTPSFKDSEIFQTKILNIDVTENDFECNDLVFCIQGVSEQLYNSLLNMFPCIDNNFGKTINTSNGAILLDARFKGQMFVEGLYIQTDANFKYGYNFNVETVQLDRDR